MMATERRRRFPSIRLSIAVVFALSLLIPAALSGRSTAWAQTDPGFAAGDVVVVEADGLHLHTAAAQASEVLAVLPDGTQGVVVDGPEIADGYAMYQLDVAGTLGWAAADWLSLAEAAHTVMAVGDNVVVIADVLNVRADATIDADIVTTLEAGDTAVVLDGPVSADDYEWYQVYSGGDTGWVVRNYLAFEPQNVALIAVGDTATVNTDGLNLRDGATTGANVLDELPSGSTVTILDGPVEADGFTWFQVSSDAGTGWVVGEYLIV